MMFDVARPTRSQSVVPWLGGALIVCFVAASAAGAGAAPAFERAAIALTVGSLLIIACHVEPAWLAATGIALTVFSGNWDSLGFPLPLDRLCVMAAFVSVVVRYLYQPSPRAPIIKPIHSLLLAAGLVALVSAIWTGTLSAHDTRFALLDAYGLVPFAMFILAPLIFPGAHERAILLGALVLTGAYLGLTAVFETFGLDGLVWPRYVLDSAVGVHADRARGPFVEAAANGLGLYACGVAAAVLLATRRWPLARAASAAVMLLCAAGLLFTLTRSIWLSSVVASASAMLMTSKLRRLMLPVGIVAAVAVGALLTAAPSVADQARQRNAEQRPIWDRENLNAAAFRMIADRPLQGFGYGRASTETVDFTRQADDQPLTSAEVGIHNAFVKLAVELGIFGALLWIVAWLATVGAAALRRGPPELEPWRIGLLAIAIQGLVVQNLIPGSYAFPVLVTWTLAGILWAARDDRGVVVEETRG